MALTYQKVSGSLGGDVAIGLVTFDASYATGGLAFDASKINGNTTGLSNVIATDVATGAHQGKQVAWDSAANKLVALTAAGVEVAAATDLSALVVRVQVWR